MFGLFKADPVKKLEKEYEALLTQAMHAQREGDIKGYARLSSEAEKILKDIQAQKNQKSG